MSIQFWGEGSGGGPLPWGGKGYSLNVSAPGAETWVGPEGSGGRKPWFAWSSAMGMAGESVFCDLCDKLAPVPNMVMVVGGKGRMDIAASD